MKKIDAYKCEYCKHISPTLTGIKLHETACSRNPENWAKCSDCQHLKQDTYTWLETERYDRQSKYFTCDKLNKVVLPIKLKRSRFLGEIKESLINCLDIDSVEFMPTQCNSFEQKDYSNIHEPF